MFVSLLMEKFNNSESWEQIEKKKRWRPRKEKINEELLQNLQSKEAPIPDWKNFDIQKVANFDTVNWTLVLENVKEDKDWTRFVYIEWRKYVEAKDKLNLPDSFYQVKWKTLFIWDKIEWTTFWDGISYRCSSFATENIHLEERKSKYNGNDWVLYLWKLYRTGVRATNETITEIRRNWKLVKITKDMVDRVLSWTANWTEIANIKYAAKTDPEFFAYFESLRQ